MLKELIQAGFGQNQDYNCAEKILYGANQAYHLGLSEESLRLSAGFGGGLAVEETCGALCGAVMVLSCLQVKTVAHETLALKPSLQELISKMKSELGTIQCNQLKAKYRTPEKKCQVIIETVAQLLDQQIVDLLGENRQGAKDELH